MDQKVRILLSVGSLGMGGTEIFVMNLFRNLDKDRFQADFVVYDNDRLEFYEEVLQAGSTVHFCAGVTKNSLLCLLEEMVKTYRVLRDGKYDVLHCHSCSFKGLFQGAVPGALVRGTKVITHAHSVGTPKDTHLDSLLRKGLRWLLSNLINYGFSCSDTAGESKYTERLLKSSRYHVIHNAVDVERYSFSEIERQTIRARLGIEDETLVLGNVGRIEREKNHSFLLEIFAQVHTKQKNSKLLLIGDGSLLEEGKQKAQSLGIQNSVLFLGRQDSAAPYYHAMDCFVMPSLYEGFPFVLVEAQINGLKCVVADTITSSVNISGGVRFESLASPTEQWAEVILESAQKRLLPSQVETVCSQYDLKRETRKIEEIYCI